MRKVDCRDCACLIETDATTGWCCDDCGKLIKELDFCPNGLEPLQVGDEVYWEDPEEKDSGFYKVVKFINDDLALIKNKHIEVEVFWHEIS